jgi:molybdenum cofactor cytidylyltransferase
VSGIGVIVLAAGGSTRMGRPKQLLELAGQSLLRRAARSAIDSGCVPVIVVLGCEADAMAGELGDLPASMVVNSGWQRGIGSSIRTGVDWLVKNSPGTEGVVIMLCDQPLIDSQVIRRLIDAHRASGKVIAVSEYSGTSGPPVLVSGSSFRRLLTLPDGQGAKVLWADRQEEVCFVACEEGALDLDTSAEYDRTAREF